MNRNGRQHRRAAGFALVVSMWFLCGAGTRLEAQSLFSRLRPPQHVVLELENNERVEGTLQQLTVAMEAGALASVEIASGHEAQSYPLVSVRRMNFCPTDDTVVASDVSVKYFSLGRAEGRIPEPPDWYRLNGDATAWKPAVPAHPNYNWLYIPGAAWIWSSKKWYESGNEVCLFRHEFDLKRGQRIVSGTLILTADYALDSVFLNEMPLSAPKGSLVGDKTVFDVAHLLREGKNILAARVRNDDTGKLNSACLGYRLSIASAPGEPAKDHSPGTVALLINGDVVSGELASMSERTVNVQTPYALVAMDRDWVTMLYLNYEPVRDAKGEKEKRGLIQKILGKEGIAALGKAALVSHQPFSRRMEPPDTAERRGLALKNGDFIDARLLDADEETVAVKPEYGNVLNISFGDVKAIYLNPKKESGVLRYEPEDEQYRARLTLANGDRVSGLLAQMNGSQVVFKPPYSDAIKLNANDIISCDLPYHYMMIAADRVKQARSGGGLSVALIGDPSRARADKAKELSEESLYYRVNKALFQLGIEAKWLDAAKTANREILSPDNFGLLINVDENEHYYETYQHPKDSYEAIRGYVKAGGNFAHFAQGTPFYYAYRPVNGRWVTFTGANTLNNDLGLMIAAPGEVSPGNEAFELPENKTMRLYFEMDSQSPFAANLPARVEFPVVRDSRFRPIRRAEEPAGAEFHALYSLKDSTGKNYGVAMAVVQFSNPTRYAVYASHLLLDASYEDEPMLDYLLPHLITLTLTEKR